MLVWCDFLRANQEQNHDTARNLTKPWCMHLQGTCPVAKDLLVETRDSYAKCQRIRLIPGAPETGV